MKNGRAARTRSGGSTSAKGGRLQKHTNGHSKPSQNFSDAHPKTGQGRTGYTEGESRMGAGKYGVKATVG